MKEASREGTTARAHVLVAGRVQGVGYRFAAQWRAGELELSGWVRNLADGRVEVLCEGVREKVEALVQWCWRGPTSAEVTDVNVVWEPARGDLIGFSVRR